MYDNCPLFVQTISFVLIGKLDDRDDRVIAQLRWKTVDKRACLYDLDDLNSPLSLVDTEIADLQAL